MSQEGLKPAKGGSSEAGITIENGALVIDNPSKISAVDSALSENYSETDTLEKGKQDDKPNNAYQRHRQRMRESRKWCVGTWCALATLLTLVILAIVLPIVYFAIIPAIANSSVSSAQVQIDTVSLGAEDLEQNTIATTIQGSITGMPSFRVETGASSATLIDDATGTEFGTTEMPALAGSGGRLDLNLDSLMRLSNRAAFDNIARNMINKGEPGKIRMRSSNVPVSVWLGPLKLAVYGGVDIEQVITMDAINGLNQVEVSDTVKLLRASESELAIGMDITLQNPSKTTVLADKGLRLELMSAANKLIGHVELAPFQLKQGPNPITAQAVIRYTNPVQAGIMRRRAAGGSVADNTRDVRDFLDLYMAGASSKLWLRGPDSDQMPGATYVQRALANWLTSVELPAQQSTNFVTATRIAGVEPFQEFGKLIINAEVSATNPFDLPVTVRNVSIVITMNDQQVVGNIEYESGQVIPAKGDVTLTGLSTRIDIGPFLGNIITDAFDWVGSMITGKGPTIVGDVSLAGFIDVRIDGKFPIFLPIKSLNVPLANLTDPNSLAPAG